MSESSNQYWTYFDEAWKQIIERFFPQFVRFFVPELHEAIDFQNVALFKFIDWVIRLNDAEEIRLWDEIQTLEEVNKMPYITSVERIGRAEGAQLEGQQMILDALDERFGELPDTVSAAIHQIQDQAQLRLLLRQAIRSESLEEFQSILNGN